MTGDHVSGAVGPVFPRTPTLLGHRGLGRGTVEGHEQNTAGSFLAAVDHGLDWVEVDVRRTRDDHLVVAHDPAYPDGSFVVDLTGEQVRLRDTLHLTDLLDALPDHVGVNFDLKSSMQDAVRPAGRTTAALLGPVAGREARRRQVAVTSFDPSALLLLRAQVPALPLGLLTWWNYPAEHAVCAAAHLDVQLLAVHVGSLWYDPEASVRPGLRSMEDVVSLVHDAGRQLMAWCPDLAQAHRLLDAGADALVVDDVPRTVPELATYAGTAARSHLSPGPRTPA